MLLFQNDIMSELWEGEIDIIAMKNVDINAPKDFSEAARIQEIFIDYLSFCSASTSSHLLEDRFSQILSEEEKQFKEFLVPILQNVPQHLYFTEPFQNFLLGIKNQFRFKDIKIAPKSEFQN